MWSRTLLLLRDFEKSKGYDLKTTFTKVKSFNEAKK